MAAMSSAQIVSASAIHNKAVAQGLGIHPPMGPTYPPYTSQVSLFVPFRLAKRYLPKKKKNVKFFYKCGQKSQKVVISIVKGFLF